MSKIDLLKDLYTFNNTDVTIKNIVVLGCGGTGAYVVSHLARIIASLNSSISLVLVDGDEVEQKNLKRQHFISPDLGRNKAEVLASRYSGAFGIEIAYISEYFERPSDLKKQLRFMGRGERQADLIIGCVDNNATRKIIHQVFMDFYLGTGNLFWIDAGNEETAGQVVCGYMPHKWLYSDGRIFSLPIVTEVYPEMLEANDKFASELSCAERAEAAPQNMMTNVTAATLVLNYAQSLIFKRPMKSFGTTFNINNVFSIMRNTKENLMKVSENRRHAMDRQILRRKVGN